MVKCFFRYSIYLLVSFQSLYGQSNRTPEKQILIKKSGSVSQPPLLEVLRTQLIEYSEPKNGLLDAFEEGKIKFILSNRGLGVANNPIVRISSDQSILGLTYPKSIQLEDLNSEQEIQVEIPIKANANLETGEASFLIEVLEWNGFDADPLKIVFSTQRFLEPKLVVADYLFSSIGGGSVEQGKTASLNLIIQNRGQGIAKEGKLKFFNEDDNFFILSDREFKLPDLNPNESYKVKFDFLVNKRYSKSVIDIQVELTEKFGKYGLEDTLTVDLIKNLKPTEIIVHEGIIQEEIPISELSLTSEVDQDIPIFPQKDNRIALIIGNEDYQTYQNGLSGDQNVAFARNDALTFEEYAVKTLGVPSKQSFLLTDGTKGQMSREIERVVELARLTDNAELIFFYAGHGLPDQVTREAYLMPVDVTAANLDEAISLKKLYSELASTQADKIYVFLDACFSGGGRGENGLLAARTVKVEPKSDIVEGNIVVFAATTGDQVSLPFEAQYHGLFTYHVLNKLKETNGRISLSDMKSYLEVNVPKASLIENGMNQTPQVLVSPELGDKWMFWSFR